MHDDGCHLDSYVYRSQFFKIESKRSDILAKTKIFVDRFHFKSHVGKDCRINNNPDSFLPNDAINTSVCEQTNFWFGVYKNILKHMSRERFYFMIYLLCDEHNTANLIDQKKC